MKYDEKKGFEFQQIDGNKIIDTVVLRMKSENKLCDDSSIVRAIHRLTVDDIKQLMWEASLPK